MPRPVILLSSQWTDVGLEDLGQRAREWGYQGLDLSCWGDHFEVQRAVSEPEYCQEKLDLLGRYELSIAALSNFRVSQAVCDRIEPRHRKILPDYVWGDGDPAGVQERAAEEMIATIRAAQTLGVGTVAGFTGSSIWGAVLGFPPADAELVAEGFADFAHRWHPILDVCQEANVRYAVEVRPGQLAFDLYSAERLLEAAQGREELGFAFDPSHLHWQGIDPVEFLRRFPDRIYHVHFKDIALNLNGRSGLLGSYLPFGDSRRGWNYRAPGHGGIDWEGVIRTLNDLGYDGPLGVEIDDRGMHRDHGAEEACRFVQRLDFPPPGQG